MCRYCNYNLPIHYLLNDAPKLSDNIDEQLNAFIAQEDSSDLDLDNGIKRSPGFAIATEDLIKTNISVTEEQIITHKLSDDLFDNTLQGQREYRATLVSGEELPDWIDINPENGQLKIEPEYEEIGTHEIIVEATDQLGEVASSLVSLEVVSKEGENTLLIEDQTNAIIEKETEIGYDNFIPEEIVSLPEISINDVQATDSSVGRELTFTISLNAVSNETVTVEYGTADNTAIAGEDYIPVNGTITFAPGEKEKTVTVNTTGTSYLDSDESFTLRHCVKIT